MSLPKIKLTVVLLAVTATVFAISKLNKDSIKKWKEKITSLRNSLMA